MRAEDLRARIERRGDATVVRLDGVLDVDSSPSLRSAVLGCLAAEPSVIVLDVADLRHRDDVALTVLPALAQHAAAWPGSAMTLAAARPPLARALDRMAVARLVPLFPTTDAALADCADRAKRTGRGSGPDATGPAERLRVTLQPMLDATAAARHLVGRACARWGVERVRDVAELVVTELVSNVLRHAGTEMEVGVARDHRLLHVSVRDHAPALPRLGGREERAPERHDHDGHGHGRDEARGRDERGDEARGGDLARGRGDEGRGRGDEGRGRGDEGRGRGDEARGRDDEGRGGDLARGRGDEGRGRGDDGRGGKGRGRDGFGVGDEPPREDGRGLLVVGALTQAWGCTQLPDGKVVWATLRI
jgi:anti-anti-sigma factor